jgi:hypothetical protein
LLHEKCYLERFGVTARTRRGAYRGPPKNSDFFYKNTFVPFIKHRVLLKVSTVPLRAHLSLTGRRRRMAVQRQIRNNQNTEAASRKSPWINLALTIRSRKALKNLKEFSSC